MKKALLVLGILFLFSSQGFADVFTVTNCDDSGAGSLRQALTDAQTGSGHTIIFDITSAEVGYAEPNGKGCVTNEAGTTWFRILAATALPDIQTSNIQVLGSSQTREATNPGVKVEIRATATLLPALRVYSGGTGATIEGLVFNRHGGSGGVGIELNGADNCHIYSCGFSVTATGEAPAPTQLAYGIKCIAGAQNNVIGGGGGLFNVLSNCGTAGIWITGADSINNRVQGNFIGTNYTGTAGLPNGNFGVYLNGEANNNLIGGTGANEGNLISKNGNAGVKIEVTGTNSNEIIGNFIGTDVNGTGALGNFYGVYVDQGPKYNVIGGPSAAERNIISGNTNDGVRIRSLAVSTSYNRILGNYIGLDMTGDSPLPNGQNGVVLSDAASNNYIGGSAAGEGNVISGNAGSGVYLMDSGTDYNEILGNLIGTDKDGDTDLGNGIDGIRLRIGPQYNKIGDGTAGGRNVIAGNGSAGVVLDGTGVSSNEVLGNYIGVDISGAGPLPNSQSGVILTSAGVLNLIGNGTAGGRNIISGNNQYGVYLDNTSSNLVLGNYVGTDSTGTLPKGNGWTGVIINASSNYNKIGDGTAGGRNVISGGSDAGLAITTASNSNEVLGNFIGTKADGTGDLGNNNYGVIIRSGSKFNKVGEGSTGGRNVICGNADDGIRITEDNTTSNEVIGNYIGVEADGLTARGNDKHGLEIYGSGVTDPYNQARSNVIANNGAGNPVYHGIYVVGNGAYSEKLSQNSIYNNAGKGIKLSSGGNTEIASPEIKTVLVDRVAKTLRVTGEGAVASAIVEIFGADNYGQGMRYGGSIIADLAGKFDGTMSYTGSPPAEGSPIVATQTDSVGNTSEFGPSSEATYIPYSYQPDLAAATLESGADYKTIGVYENTPSTQMQSLSLATNEAAVFYFKELNAGNSTDTITVSGEGSSGSFTVKYLAGKTGTAEVVMPDTSVIASGASGEGRVQITYSGNVIATKEVTITATTTNDATKKDAVKVIATFVPLPEPIPPTPPTPTPHTTQEFTETQLGVAGMHITIPSGACTVDVTVTASTVTAPGAPPAGYSVGGQTFNIGSTPVNTFLIPVTVTIPITGPLTFPKVYYWDGTKWSTEGIVIVSHTATSLTFTTTHFTIFAPMATLPSNMVRFGPNPYNPNNGSGKFWYVLSADADTTIYLIDLAGTVQFKQTYPAGTNGGKNGENNITYNGNTSWGDQLGQGVYIYKIVQGGKAIGGGKIAVIK